MTRYSLKRRTRKYVKGYDLFDSREIYPTNMGKKIVRFATETGLDTAKKQQEYL